MNKIENGPPKVNKRFLESRTSRWRFGSCLSRGLANVPFDSKNLAWVVDGPVKDDQRTRCQSRVKIMAARRINDKVLGECFHHGRHYWAMCT